MEKLIIASLRQSAGKTSFIVGLAEATGKKIGYMKPFGDRLIYHKKRLWDYDAALVANILSLPDHPEDMSIGLEHTKLVFMDREQIEQRLGQSTGKLSQEKEILFIEGGKNLSYGASVHLDTLSLARCLQCPVILVVGADHESIDEITFAKRSIDLSQVNFKGVVVNKAHDPEDFKNTHLRTIADLGIHVFGIMPHHADLNCFSVEYVADRLFAKVIAGEGGLQKVVKNIFVGAMSANAAIRSPKFNKENKLIITAGDRVDMILAALDSDATCIILTNNILPPAHIISKATDGDIPLLLVAADTYQIAQQIDNMEPLLTPGDANKIKLLGELVGEHVTFDDLFSDQAVGE